MREEDVDQFLDGRLRRGLVGRAERVEISETLQREDEEIEAFLEGKGKAPQGHGAYVEGACERMEDFVEKPLGRSYNAHTGSVRPLLGRLGMRYVPSFSLHHGQRVYKGLGFFVAGAFLVGSLYFLVRVRDYIQDTMQDLREANEFVMEIPEFLDRKPVRKD
ncbi:hypothetical protein CMI48_01155 [Candidatus Pacearchaeota archaeon]|nr:hypothetical protein [Candidatus Pacearchaeota archaeon]|tara:strand:- start:209 stop:694 length:486 start_codon:yes stop_codon:yes gene_type:complete